MNSIATQQQKNKQNFIDELSQQEFILRECLLHEVEIDNAIEKLIALPGLIAERAREESVLDDYFEIDQAGTDAEILDTDEQEFVGGRTLLTLREASLESGETTRRLRELCRSGELDGEKYNGYWMVCEKSLDAYMETLEEEEQADEINDTAKDGTDLLLPVVYQPATPEKKSNFVYQPVEDVVFFPEEQAAEYMLQRRVITGEAYKKALELQEKAPKRKTPWSLFAAVIGLILL